MSTIHVVSYSEMDTFRQCPHKWDLSYQQRWRPPETSRALAVGSLWHAVLEQHYLAIMAKQAGEDAPAVGREGEKQISTLLHDESGEQSEEQVLVEWMYAGYLDQYGLDPEWTILAVEWAGEFWLPTPRGTRSRLRLKMRLDLIVRDPNGNIWVVDHKSGRDLPRARMLEMDDQFGLYTWGLHQLGKRALGAIYSAARTQRNKTKEQPLDERFSRTGLYRTDNELATIAREAYRTFRRAYTIKPGEAERAPDSDRCSWRCPYTEACLAGRKGVDEQQYLVAAGFTQDWTRH